MAQALVLGATGMLGSLAPQARAQGSLRTQLLQIPGIGCQRQQVQYAGIEKQHGVTITEQRKAILQCPAPVAQHQVQAVALIVRRRRHRLRPPGPSRHCASA